MGGPQQEIVQCGPGQLIIRNPARRLCAPPEMLGFRLSH